MVLKIFSILLSIESLKLEIIVIKLNVLLLVILIHTLLILYYRNNNYMIYLIKYTQILYILLKMLKYRFFLIIKMNVNQHVQEICAKELLFNKIINFLIMREFVILEMEKMIIVQALYWEKKTLYLWEKDML
jgi:hypothetical protein